MSIKNTLDKKENELDSIDDFYVLDLKANPTALNILIGTIVISLFVFLISCL